MSEETVLVCHLPSVTSGFGESDGAVTLAQTLGHRTAALQFSGTVVSVPS